MDQVTKRQLAQFICGDDQGKHPIYRSSQYLTQFFHDVGINVVHDGSTRWKWVYGVLEQLDPSQMEKIILRLASPKLYSADKEKTRLALSTLNNILEIEGLSVSLEGITPIMRRGEPSFDLGQQVNEEALDLSPPDFSKFPFESNYTVALEARWKEVSVAITARAYTAAIILMGSLLEGVILGVLITYPQIANRSSRAPKDPQTGKNRHFPHWSL